MQICGDFSLDLKAKYRLLMKDLRRLVLPYMRPGIPNLQAFRICHADPSGPSKLMPQGPCHIKVHRLESRAEEWINLRPVPSSS